MKLEHKTIEELYPGLLNKEAGIPCHVCKQSRRFEGNRILCGCPDLHDREFLTTGITRVDTQAFVRNLASEPIKKSGAEEVSEMLAIPRSWKILGAMLLGLVVMVFVLWRCGAGAAIWEALRP